MKIGIITSGSETLSLFAFLAQYDHEYIIYYDFFHWPYGDKTFDQSLACVEKGIDYLTEKGVEYIIVPPVYELSLLQNPKILPLFKTYLFDYVFKYSLIGKIGLFGDFADIQVAQDLVKQLATTYTLADNQKAIKKFHFPFTYWTKETSLWKYYLTTLSYSHILINKIIKFDLRYFKDAMVDTLIPLNYGYFHYQTTITKYLNFKKIRFHTLEKLNIIFQNLVVCDDDQKKNTYSITVAYTGHIYTLQKEKRLLWLLQRGKTAEIIWEKI